MGDAPRRPRFVPFPKSRAIQPLMEDVMYDPPAYLWAITIAGPTARTPLPATDPGCCRRELADQGSSS
jgi:hypothetical protein